MSRNSIVTLDTRKLNALIRKIPGNVADAVAATAFAIERQAKINAPVDTSALRGSIYARIGKGFGSVGTAWDEDGRIARTGKCHDRLCRAGGGIRGICGVRHK